MNIPIGNSILTVAGHDLEILDSNSYQARNPAEGLEFYFAPSGPVRATWSVVVYNAKDVFGAWTFLTIIDACSLEEAVTLAFEYKLPAPEHP